MATGKSRANRRSSGGSCSSTATTTVFVLVCVLFLWMFTSNSLISPQKKTNNDTSILDSFSDSFHRKIILPAKIPTEEAVGVGTLKAGLFLGKAEHFSSQNTQATTAFEDNPGDLPEEAMKSGDDPDPVQETDRGSSKQELKEAEYKHEHESNDTSTVLEADDDTVNDSDAGKQEAEWQTETIMPDNRHTEKLITAKESSENEENRHGVDHLTDEEQEKRIDDQQQREEEQSQHSETSDDQVQHDEDKPIESYSNATETKTRIENQESDATTPKKDSNKVWSTQVDQSTNRNGRTQFAGNGGAGAGADDTADVDTLGYKWELCNVTSGTDYIPCLDNEKAIRKLHGRNHFEHRERHCPEEGPVCLVPLPEGYKTPIPWPQSRDKIWFHNVPHKGLADVKGHQNWVKATGELLTFPGGGTQFIHGALQYIDFMQQAVPDIAWGKHTRVILDVGCGVASFGGYLFDRDVLAMSFAPKDEHEAQVQLALERGIPAVSAVMGTQRLPFPSRVFDLVHCARCRVPWHKEGGKLLLEVNRVLRPGGYFVWSATPVYQKLAEDVMIWNEMSVLTLSMCWELVTINKDKLNGIGVAIYRKPDTNECYNERNKQEPPMCKPNDDANAAWYVPLQTCIHKVPVIEIERGSQWPKEWPSRIQTPPYWLNKAQIGIHGKPAPDDFKADYEHWKWLVSKTYMSGLEINWSNVRNVMDMRAVYGGFAAALKDLKLWVLNVVNVDSPDTLPIIFERGLFGIYHDWCESFSTYPRTYDLLHADHLFSKLKKRCKITPVMAEVDRIVRPGGKLIVRDESNTIGEIENLLKSLHWEVHLTYYKNQEQILSAQKSNWRPKTYANPS